MRLFLITLLTLSACVGVLHAEAPLSVQTSSRLEPTFKSEIQNILIIVAKDDIEINNIIINRGNSKVLYLDLDGDGWRRRTPSYPIKMKFGDRYTFPYSGSVSIETSIETNKGKFLFKSN